MHHKNILFHFSFNICTKEYRFIYKEKDITQPEPIDKHQVLLKMYKFGHFY